MWRHTVNSALLVGALAGTATAQEQTSEAMEALRSQVDRLRREVEELRKGVASDSEEQMPDEDEELKALREEAAELAEGRVEASTSEPGQTPSEEDELRALREEAAGTTQPAGALESVTLRLNQFNPRITAFGDLIGRLQLGQHPTRVEDDESGDFVQIDDKFSLREVELDLRADIDPYSKAVLILAVEKERPDAEYEIDVEEGYATLETLPWNLRAKLGRWRQEFGIVSNTHRHDLPWVEYPYPMLGFLGEEGLIGDGAGVQWLAPGVPLEVLASVFSPSAWFVTEDSNEPDYLGRADYFIDLSERSWLRIGGSFLYGKTTPGGGRGAILGGADLTFKWVRDQTTSAVLTSELYTLRRETDSMIDDATGWFVAAQIQPGLHRWYFGARYDWSDYFDETEGNHEWAASAFVSYYTTEFLRFRIGYEHREMHVGSTGRRDDSFDTLLFQTTFIFGSHPAEPYWVNR